MGQKFAVAVLLILSMPAVAQQNAPKPRVSEAPLTSEQIAVYRSVLASYLRGSNRILNVANITDPVDVAGAACLRSLHAQAVKQSTFVVHKIGPELVADMKIILVDPDRQQATIKDNDPDNLTRTEIDDHQKVSDKQLDQSMDRAIDSGLFSLSEIVFNKRHTRAVVSYSFVCGGLCGDGNTLVLKKVGDSWNVVKRCGGWVS